MIKFENIVENREYRERVIKYFRLPIRLSVSYDKFMSDMRFLKETNVNKYNQVIEFTESDFNKLAVEQGTDTPDFSMDNVLEPIIEEFRNSDKWKEFLKKDYSYTLVNYEGITNTHSFYVKENDGKHLLSIDLESANWQSLQSILGFDESYEEIISKHTDNLIPIISKTFRTKITGKLGAKNIMDYNKYLLFSNKDAILKAIYKKTGVNLRGREPLAFYADEFIMELTGDELEILNRVDASEFEKEIYNATKVRTHFRPFTLHWIGLSKACAKVHNGKFEIINLSKDDLMLFEKVRRGIAPREVDFEVSKFKGKLNEVRKAVDLVNSLV